MAPSAASQSWDSGDYREPTTISTTNANFAHQLGIPITPESDKTYDLISLIAFAQEANPQTRIAWEQARAQAAQLGIADSDWYPSLAFSRFGGLLARYLSDAPAAAFPPTARASRRNCHCNGRCSISAGAKRRLIQRCRLCCNRIFNSTARISRSLMPSKKAIMPTMPAWRTVEAMLAALKSAQAVEEAAQARLDAGLATQPDLLLARQDRVRAQYDLSSAQRSVTDTQSALAEAVGIAPSMPLKVAPMSRTALADGNSPIRWSTRWDQALASRPDLAAQLAALRASEADVSKAKAAYYPQLGLNGSVGQAYSHFDAYTGGKTTGPFDYDDTIYGINLTLSWDIFDGFLRRNKVREAEAQRSQTAAELSALQLKAMREVWKSYVDVKTALVQYESAQALLAASQDAYDANTTKYQNGLGTLIDLLAAERELARARTTIVESRAELLDSAAALAFAVGDSNVAPAKTQPTSGQK